MSIKIAPESLPSSVKVGDTLYVALSHLGICRMYTVEEILEDGRLRVHDPTYARYWTIKLHRNLCTCVLGHIGWPCVFCGQFVEENKI